MKLVLSKHAKEKIKERAIKIEDIHMVLRSAEAVFYDID